MQLTAQMLHSAFLESYREVYGIPETQQRSWENLNDKEHLAYQWMMKRLNEKLATPDARLAAEAAAMLALIKQGLVIDEANAGFKCPCDLCVTGRNIIHRIEG